MLFSPLSVCSAKKPNGISKPAAPAAAAAKVQPKKAAPVEEEEDRTVGEGYYVEDDEDEDGEDEDDEDGEEQDGEPLGFFGRVVAPGMAGGELISAGDCRVLRLSNVALALDAPKGAKSSLLVRVADHAAADEEEEDEEEDEDKPLPIREFVVCTLNEATRPDATIELFFTGGEVAELFVVGNAPIHVTGAVSYVEEANEAAGDHEDDEDDEEGLYPQYMGEDDEDEDDEDEDAEDSEEEADRLGAAAVHKRDATKASKPVRASAKNALPSLMQELAAQGDEDELDQSAYVDEEDDEDDEDEEDEDMEEDDEDDEDLEEEDEEDFLNEVQAEKIRQSLKGKIEVVESPKPSPKLAAKAAPKPAAAAAATPAGQKRKAESEKPTAAAAASAATPAKKQKTDAPAAVKTPAPATPGAFKCASCDRSFAQEGALKQHTITKHAAGATTTPAKSNANGAPASTKKK